MIASIITTAICKLMTVFNVLIIYVVQVNVTRFISEDFVSAERFFCPDCETNEFRRSLFTLIRVFLVSFWLTSGLFKMFFAL